MRILFLFIIVFIGIINCAEQPLTINDNIRVCFKCYADFKVDGQSQLDISVRELKKHISDYKRVHNSSSSVGLQAQLEKKYLESYIHYLELMEQQAYTKFYKYLYELTFNENVRLRRQLEQSGLKKQDKNCV